MVALSGGSDRIEVFSAGELKPGGSTIETSTHRPPRMLERASWSLSSLAVIKAWTIVDRNQAAWLKVAIDVLRAALVLVAKNLIQKCHTLPIGRLARCVRNPEDCHVEPANGRIGLTAVAIGWFSIVKAVRVQLWRWP